MDASIDPLRLQHCQNFEELAQQLDLNLPQFHPYLDKNAQLQLIQGGLREMIRKHDPNPAIIDRATEMMLKCSQDELFGLIDDHAALMEKIEEARRKYIEDHKEPEPHLVFYMKPALPTGERIQLEAPDDEEEWDFITAEDLPEIKGKNEEEKDEIEEEEEEETWEHVGDVNGAMNVNRESSLMNLKIMVGKTMSYAKSWIPFSQKKPSRKYELKNS